MITRATIEEHQRELKNQWRVVIGEPTFNWKAHLYQIEEVLVTNPPIEIPVKEK